MIFHTAAASVLSPVRAPVPNLYANPACRGIHCQIPAQARGQTKFQR
jgi:hypothetical protein